MNVLVIGGTAFFGKHCVEALLARGDQVTIFSRGTRRPPFWPRVAHVAGDRTDRTAFVSALRGRPFDAVVDNIAFVRVDVEAAIAAFQGCIGHYLLTSSGSVYPDFTPDEEMRPVAEDAADLALRGDLAYAEGKRECEQAAVEQDAFPVTIVRPPIVQGPDDPSRRGWFWYQRIADGGPVLVPSRYPSAAWRQAFSRDAARVMVLAAANPKAFGRTYNVASDEILTLDDFVRLSAEIIGRPDPVVSVPRDRLRREADWYKPTYAHRFVMDIGRIKADLGFAPTPVRAWLTETIRWHLDGELADSAGYDRRAEEMALAARYR
jgi:nucleoside-diphosphate-sugar epimerase